MNHSLWLGLGLLVFASAAAAQEADPAPPPELQVPEASGPVTRQTAVRDSPLLNFEYGWPQAISADAKLVETLNADLSKNYDEATDNARENKVLVEENNGTFNQNMYNRDWSLEGETPRFYSLVASTDTFTGGAHPNHDTTAMLWDRTSQQQVQLTDLFATPEGLSGAVRAQFCKLLDAQRKEKRQGETLDGPFSECPPLSDLTIAPAGKDGKGPFTTIRMIADPYVAGPYSEGEYDVSVPVTAAFVSALKPEYRSDFSAQRPQ